MHVASLPTDSDSFPLNRTAKACLRPHGFLRCFCRHGAGGLRSMTVWQEPMLALESSRSRQFDLEGQLEASHAEVAHLRDQIAAATAAVANARGSPIAKKHYPAPGDADYSEDSLIRCLERARNLQRFHVCASRLYICVREKPQCTSTGCLQAFAVNVVPRLATRNVTIAMRVILQAADR